MGFMDVMNGIGSVLDLGSDIYSIVNNERDFAHQQEVDAFNMDMARKNYQLAVDQMNWQQQAQQTAWSREDNAIRRRVADLESAGLSKWLVAGQGAQAGGVTASNVTSGANLINSGARLKDVNLKNAVDSFFTGQERQADISLTQKQQDLISAQIDNVKQDTINKTFGKLKTVAETEQIYANMKNQVAQLELQAKEFEEQKKLWQSQKNKNSAEALQAKAKAEEIKLQAELTASQIKTYDSYFEMAKERHEDDLKNSRTRRRNETSDSVFNGIGTVMKSVTDTLKIFTFGF